MKTLYGITKLISDNSDYRFSRTFLDIFFVQNRIKLDEERRPTLPHDHATMINGKIVWYEWRKDGRKSYYQLYTLDGENLKDRLKNIYRDVMEIVEDLQ